MWRKSMTFVLGVVCFVTVAGAASAFLLGRALRRTSTPITAAAAQQRPSRGPRNLLLRAEALGVGRRLRNRFKPSSRAVSTSFGNLAIGGSQHPIALIRRQTETGETVELLLGTRALTWSDQEGTKALSSLVTDSERLLMERVVFDSPDQFVLAQLRGASYFTVARNVRPTHAADDYNGSLWNLVRVSEPERNENLRPLSPWRVYYVNVITGLPDRVEYQLNGQNIRAEFLQWTEQNGEKTPWHIRWTSGEEPVMEYRATSVSHNQ